MSGPAPEHASQRRVLATNLAALALLALGLTQLAGHVSGLRLLRGLGAASAASPLPKVFSDVRGLETYASEFTIRYELGGGTASIPLTPERYQRLTGPYNRRNVYGAALSYGPRLPEPLWESVFCYALQPDGPFRTELGVPEEASSVRVEIRTKTRGREDRWTLEPRCAE